MGRAGSSSGACSRVMVPTVGSAQTQAPIDGFSDLSAPPKPCKPWGAGTSLQTEARGVCLAAGGAGPDGECWGQHKCLPQQGHHPAPWLQAARVQGALGWSPSWHRGQEEGAELCNNPLAPEALANQAGMQQALWGRALREGQSSSTLWPAVLGMLDMGQGRAWNCSSTIQPCSEVAQEQSRRLTESSSKKHLFSEYMSGLAGSGEPHPSQSRRWLNPAIGKMGPFAPKREHCPSLSTALQGPPVQRSATGSKDHGSVSTLSWTLHAGCPRHARATTRHPMCWVLWGHTVPEPWGCAVRDGVHFAPHTTGNGKGW